MENLFNDLRFAFRTLMKTPLVTAAALISLALGIGANTTIFTLVNAFFLRGLPIEDPERLVALFTTEEKQQAGPLGNLMPVSRPNYIDLRDETDVFSHLVDVAFVPADLAAPGGEPEQVFGLQVAGGYFEVLGIEPFHGRLFGPRDDVEPGGHPVVVLSHRFWQRRFGGDRGLVGNTITLNRLPFTVVGIAPPGFEGTFTLGQTDFWAPMTMVDTFWTAFREFFDDRRALFMFVYGRLAPGVTIEQARAQVAAVGRGLEQTYPDVNENRGFTIRPLAETVINPAQRDNFERSGALMMTVVGLILLIACVNVANLLLGKAVARRREIAIRMSLGAARWRIIRQLLTESLVLALSAGVLGLAFAYWARSALWAMRPPFLQQSGLDLSLDTSVLGFTLVVAILTGVLFGLFPALRASRPGLAQDLKEGTENESGLARTFNFKNLLVTGQVALSLVALIGSGIFLRSLGEATRIDLGFEPGPLATMTFDVSRQGYDADRGEQFLSRVIERASQVPGVESAALATIVPLTGGGFMRTVYVEGRDTEAENNGLLTPANVVGPGFFKTLGIELRRGRDFTFADRAGSQTVAIVNQTMAERFWPGEDVIGKRFSYYGEEEIWEVVGVVETSKYVNVGEDPRAQAYVPRLQDYNPAISLVVRSAGDPVQTLETVRREIQSLDQALPITNPQTLASAVSQALWAPRMAAILLGVMGGLALLLASIGIYGVMAYSVHQRRHEIGIRMAMGARGSDVLKLVLSQGMMLVVAGLCLGLAVAVVAGRGIAPLLYGVSPTDVVTFTATSAVLAAVALIATLIPARRASTVDPVSVLRRER